MPALIMPPNIITGPDTGLIPQVRVFDGLTGSQELNFLAYPQNFTNGVRVALGDITGDGIPDIITAPGQGSPPNVRVYNGQTQALVANFNAFNRRCLAGIFVAAGNFDSDATLEIAVGVGNKPRVRIFDVTGGTGIQIPGPLGSFLAFRRGTPGGVRVAAGNVDGQPGDELIAAAGTGATPQVRVFNSTGAQLTTFLAYDSTFTGGVYVAAGDVNGDGRAEVITGPGQGFQPRVRVFNGSTGAQIDSFLAFSEDFLGGVRVGIVDRDRDNRADIVAGTGPGVPTRVSVFDDQSLAQLDTFFAYDPSFQGGIFVAGV